MSEFQLCLKSRTISLSSLRILVMMDLHTHIGWFLGYGTAAR
jgi:hypothetical protein